MERFHGTTTHVIDTLLHKMTFNVHKEILETPQPFSRHIIILTISINGCTKEHPYKSTR